MKKKCPTCGESRWITKEFGECGHCHETSNMLDGKPRQPGKNDAETGWMKHRPYDTEKVSPFE